MYKIPEKNWGEFLSQGETNWCWAYALGGIFSLTKHDEIAKLHETLGQRNPDGTINDEGASPEFVLKRAKEKGYIKDYKAINYAYRPRRIEEIIKALEQGIPLYMQKKDTKLETHEVRVIGFDEAKARYVVVDSGKINLSPLTVSYDVCESLYSVELTPENYAKINADFKVDTTDVKTEIEVVEPEKEEIKTEINNEPETEIEAEPKKMPFFDVKEKDWFYDDVKLCYEEGVIKGKTDEFFDATGFVTRAELCAVIARHIRDSKK